MIFDENLIAVHMKKTKLYFNKPVYLGVSILDLSKSLMYDFHYHYIKTKYGDKAKLLFNDTASLAYEITTKEISTPTLSNGLTLVTTRLIIHLELKQDLIVKCLECLRMKLVGSRLLNLLVLELNYTLTKCLMALKTKKCKGVTKNVTKRSIQFDGYREFLFSRKEQYRKMNVIRSHCHEIYTEEINKIALSSDDDKRDIMADEIHTLAYGRTNFKKL